MSNLKMVGSLVNLDLIQKTEDSHVEFLTNCKR